MQLEKNQKAPLEDHHSIKRTPYQQPHSELFFKLVKQNDVLKCLSMLKENRNLTEDCDEERKTALHWAC